MARQTPRELGLWLGNLPTGEHNDITDVPGVKVGHISLIAGEGRLQSGKGPIRTGVTAIMPHGGNMYTNPCNAGLHVFNGFGKSVGTAFILENGYTMTPVMLTNVLSIADVASGLTTYMLGQNPIIGDAGRTPNLTVFECDDQHLNDIRGRHVKPIDAISALKRASSLKVEQGSVGAGVGMSCFELKGGIGSSSRIINLHGDRHTLGVLALCNFGHLDDLIIEGVPVGKLLDIKTSGYLPGSLIVIGITDAPLSRWQLQRLSQRAFLGMARTGGYSHTGSGEFSLMISNHQPAVDLDRITTNRTHVAGSKGISDWEMDQYYLAMVEATAESILNSLFMSDTMEGRDNHIRYGLPIKQTLEIIQNFRK